MTFQWNSINSILLLGEVGLKHLVTVEVILKGQNIVLMSSFVRGFFNATQGTGY